jgi:hypothetical protein
MGDFRELAKAYSKAGYSCIPVTREKVPSIRNWGLWQMKPMTEEECEKHFANCYGLALLMGGAKKLSAIDFDLKFDLTDDLMDRFKKSLPKKLLEKMYVQTTVNGGFHFIFKCEKIEPNQKLCSRYTTPYEQHHVYLDNFNNPKTRDKALRIAANHRFLTTIETRGGTNTICGGYVLMNPTPNYTHVYGKIQEISIEEYDLLMEIARSFNEVIEERKDIRLDKYKEWELSPFTDFNERFDVISYLEDNGWEVMKGSGKSIRLKRSGNPSSGSSALFDPESRLLNVFSTSTIFDVNRAYTASDIYILLECENDTSLAFKKLVEMNFGEEK